LNFCPCDKKNPLRRVFFCLKLSPWLLARGIFFARRFNVEGTPGFWICDNPWQLRIQTLAVRVVTDLVAHAYRKPAAEIVAAGAWAQQAVGLELGQGRSVLAGQIN